MDERINRKSEQVHLDPRRDRVDEDGDIEDEFDAEFEEDDNLVDRREVTVYPGRRA